MTSASREIILNAAEKRKQDNTHKQDKKSQPGSGEVINIVDVGSECKAPSTVYIDPSLEEIWEVIETTDRNILLIGPGGVGKSYLIKEIYELGVENKMKNRKRQQQPA